jgi:hypothetical protein
VHGTGHILFLSQHRSSSMAAFRQHQNAGITRTCICICTGGLEPHVAPSPAAPGHGAQIRGGGQLVHVPQVQANEGSLGICGRSEMGEIFREVLAISNQSVRIYAAHAERAAP